MLLNKGECYIMKNAEFTRLITDLFNSKCLDILKSKGPEYQNNINDEVFANFIKTGETIGIARELVAYTFLDKHMNSIGKFIRDISKPDAKIHDIIDNLTEPFEYRIADAINYLLLIYGMIYEKSMPESRVNPDILDGLRQIQKDHKCECNCVEKEKTWNPKNELIFKNDPPCVKLTQRSYNGKSANGLVDEVTEEEFNKLKDSGALKIVYPDAPDVFPKDPSNEDLILVKDQTDAPKNGIYVCNDKEKTFFQEKNPKNNYFGPWFYNGTWGYEWPNGWIYDPNRLGRFKDDWEWDGNFVHSPIPPAEYFGYPYPTGHPLDFIKNNNKKRLDLVTY
jgi:hypothetical protein